MAIDEYEYFQNAIKKLISVTEKSRNLKTSLRNDIRDSVSCLTILFHSMHKELKKFRDEASKQSKVSSSTQSLPLYNTISKS